MPSKPLVPFPGCMTLPRDLDGDGLYEDIIGDGVFDADDVSKFIDEFDWACANQPPELFDFNGNGGLDFADMNTLNALRLTPAPYGTPDTGAAPLSVAFDDASSNPTFRWTWSFGDGETSTQQHPTHVYRSPGVYTVTLAAEDGEHVVRTVTRQDAVTVTAALAPVAAFMAKPISGTAPLVIAFMDQSTNAPTSWLWDFGDLETSGTQHPTHSYAAAGTYDVTLTATNPSGSDTLTKTGYITVTNPAAPVGSFTISPPFGAIPLAVQFVDTSTNDPTSWAWDFGDGGASEARAPVHTYTSPGIYAVALSATNASGTGVVQVLGAVVAIPPVPLPEASFVADLQEGPVPLAVPFHDASRGGAPTSWSWDFGDGETATAAHPVHTYAVPGIYHVAMIASNAAGPATATRGFFVHALPAGDGDPGGAFGLDGFGPDLPITTPAAVAEPGPYPGYGQVLPASGPAAIRSAGAYGLVAYSLPITARTLPYPEGTVAPPPGYGYLPYPLPALHVTVRATSPIRRIAGLFSAGPSTSGIPSPDIPGIPLAPIEHRVFWILNRNRHTIGVIDAVDRFAWTRRWRAPHSFELVVPRDVFGAEVFRKPPCVEADDVARYIAVTIDGELRVAEIEVNTFETSNEGPSGSAFTIQGRSLAHLFDERIVLYKTDQGDGRVRYPGLTADQVMRALVYDNVTNPMDAARRIDILLTGYGVDSAATVDFSARFETVSEALEALSIASDSTPESDAVNPGGVGFDVVYDPANRTWRFDVRIAPAREATGLHLFSLARENVKRVMRQANVAGVRTVALVATDGDGAERQVRAVASGDTVPTGRARREVYVDASDLASAEEGADTEIATRGRQKLAETASAIAIEFDVLNDGTSVYREDFDLGDIVRVEVGDEIATVARIVEVQEEYTATGREIAVVCGTSVPTLGDAVRQDVRTLARVGRR